jgi:TIR domain
MDFHAFLSYAQVDDEYANGAVSQLRTLIEKEGRRVTGQKLFTIFRDKDHIFPGETFEFTIAEALKQSFILIPIITPTYFESEPCLRELEQFIEKENILGRQDLVIPIYFVEANDMLRTEYAMQGRPENVQRAASIFKQRQYVDFRQFCRTGFLEKDGSPKLGVDASIEKIGIAIRTAFRTYRAQDEPPSSAMLNDKKEPFTPADLSMATNALFRERLSQFKEEKELLADKFGDYLLARLENYCQNQDQKVLLFIGSGTTLFHFFKKIGGFAKNLKQQANRIVWIDNLAIVTNNLEGAQSLIEEGETANEKVADAIIECVILPGTPSSTYGGTLAPSHSSQFHDVFQPVSTPEVINAIAARAKARTESGALPEGTSVKIISLVAGNWVRIRQSVPRIALPLAREQAQYEITQTLIDVSDEVYLVTPLGKIFADHPKEEVYGVLQSYINKRHPSQPLYREIEHLFDANKIRLMTTYRSEDDILVDLSDLLGRDDFFDAQKISTSDFLNKLPPFKQSEFQFVPNLMFEYSPRNKDINQQKEIEFPHPQSRNREFMGMFHLRKSSLDALTRG